MKNKDPLVYNCSDYAIEVIYTEKKSVSIRATKLKEVLRKARASGKKPLLSIGIKDKDTVYLLVCYIKAEKARSQK